MNTPKKIGGQLLLPTSKRELELVPGWMQVEEGIITKVVRDSIPSDLDLGGENSLIAPGLIDTHWHFPQIDAFGAYGMRLLEWLSGVIFPCEANWSDPAYAKRRAASAIDQLFAVGTTSFVAFSSNHYEATRQALQLCEARGMRAAVGQALCDMEIQEDLKLSTDQCISDARRLLEEFHPQGDEHGRVAACVAPRFALTCTMDLMKECGKLMREYDAIMECHLSENEPECARAIELHGGPDYTSVYERAELLGPRAIYGHCIHLSPDERARLAKTATIMSHCPTSNSFLRSGTMNRAQWLRDNLIVAAGTDIGAGFEKSMIRVGRSMLEVTMYVNETPPSSAEAWWQISQGNAEALGWDKTGCLAEGFEADYLVIEPSHDWRKCPCPLNDIMWSWDDRWLKTTVVNGQIVYNNPDPRS